MAVHPNIYIDPLLWRGPHWGNPAVGPVTKSFVA